MVVAELSAVLHCRTQSAPVSAITPPRNQEITVLATVSSLNVG
jgi:hypothetical protein